MGRRTRIQSFLTEDLRKRTRYLKFPVIVVLRTFLSQKRLFCIDSRDWTWDRRFSKANGDSSKREGKEKRKKREKVEERRNKSPFNDFFFAPFKARLESIVQSKRERILRSKSSRRILGSASANSLALLRDT